MIDTEEVINRISSKVCISCHVDANQLAYTPATQVIEQAVIGALNEFKMDLIRAIVEEMLSDEKIETNLGLR